jgi:moderate conductance mechanosensitive channel
VKGAGGMLLNNYFLLDNLIKSLFVFDLDISKGGIKLGSLFITNKQINDITFKIISIIFTIIIMYIVVKLSSRIIDRTIKKQGRFKFSLDEKKANTLGAVLKSILKYIVYFLGIGYILTEIFGTISLTLASIGGVAIGFGSQSIVKDIINGFFILFEDQFSVGDLIEVNSKSGIVESIELRVTKIRDFSGDLHIIPNGMVAQVTNRSRGDMRFLVEVDIAYEEDIDNAITVLQETCDEFKKDNENLVDGPKVIGVTALRDSGITIRVFGRAKPMTQWENEHKLRKELKLALDKAGIEIPYPRRKIIN